MGYLLYVVAVILIVGWALGFFAFHAGGIIHVLLVIAVIAIVLKVIKKSLRFFFVLMPQFVKMQNCILLA
jgi:hypothetical protein